MCDHLHASAVLRKERVPLLIQVAARLLCYGISWLVITNKYRFNVKFNFKVTNFMEYSPSWEAKSTLSWSRNSPYFIEHKVSLLRSQTPTILSKKNQIQTPNPILYCNVLGLFYSRWNFIAFQKSKHYSRQLSEHKYTSDPHGLGTLTPIEFFQQDLLWQS
jgi:hypothetical protein